MFRLMGSDLTNIRTSAIRNAMKIVLVALLLAVAALPAWAAQAMSTKQHQKSNAETRRDAKLAKGRDTSRAPLILGIAH